MTTQGPAVAGDRAALGRFGEDLAVRYLTDRGYRVLARNWRCGRQGEIDIVALTPNGGCIVVVEVKTRSALAYGSPLEAVTWSKAMRLRRLAAAWCATSGTTAPLVRVDVIGVLAPDGAVPEVMHVEGVTG